jgi:hypothetical protein
MANGAEMPPGVRAQNAAIGHLILDVSLRYCHIHDDRRLYHIYNFMLYGTLLKNSFYDKSLLKTENDFDWS